MRFFTKNPNVQVNIKKKECLKNKLSIYFFTCWEVTNFYPKANELRT